MDKAIIQSPHAPQAVGPYSLAVQAGNMVFLSGQLGIDPADGNLLDGFDDAAVEVVICIAQDLVQLGHLAAPLRVLDVQKNTIALFRIDQPIEQGVPLLVIKIIVTLCKASVIEQLLVRNHQATEMQQGLIKEQIQQRLIERQLAR